MRQSLLGHDGISLRELFAGAEFHGAADIRATGCSADSRTCQVGDVFVAIEGTHANGRDFVAEALVRGAVAIVTDREIEVTVPSCRVGDARDAFARICHALAGQPGRRLRLIGVTGTNGKTTTTHLIASVLRAGGYRAGLSGTLGYHDGFEATPPHLTTPPADALAGWLGRMVDHGCSHGVMEVSSHAIEQHRIAGLEFAQAGLTNLGRDHLDYHPSLDHYHATKLRLFQNLAAAGAAVINVDDPVSRRHAPSVAQQVITIGMRAQADLTGRLLERFKSEQTFLLTAGKVSIPVRTAMIGDHNLYNCLMAAAVGLAEGIELTTVVAGLEAVRCVPGRLERIECGQPFGVFVDFAHTADALAVALDTLREVTPGRILCVFGAGGNRDTTKRPLMGRTVERRADLAIVTNDNPRLEEPQAIAAQILAGFEHPGDARWVPNRTEAIGYALSLAGPDDTVLLAGRGAETHQTVGRERLALDDREVARRYLYNLEPTSRFGALMSVGNS